MLTQQLFFDDDDKVYLCTSRLLDVHSSDPHNGAVVMGCEVDLQTGQCLTRPVVLRQSLEANLCTEAPHILKRGDFYYLLVAEGGTEINHQARIYRSRSPLGPYDDAPEGVNPIMFNGTHPVVQNSGHADFVEDLNGNHWAFFLAVRVQANGHRPLGRETFMAPVEWTASGWPVINKGRPITLDVLDASKLPEVTPYRGWRDTFAGSKSFNTGHHIHHDALADDTLLETLGINWYHLRVPVKPHHSLQPGRLTLHGNAFTIADTDCPAMLLVKQTELSGTWSTQLDFEPTTVDQEAGVTVYWSCYAYAALVVRKSHEPDGHRQVVLRWIDEHSEDVKVSSAVVCDAH